MKYDRARRHHVAGLFAPRERVRFKSTPQVPTPASPQVTSAAQTQSNVDTAIANATLGNVNTSNPYSSNTYTQTGTTNVDGYNVPSYSESTTLNPTLQGILTGTENTAASLVPTGQTLANNAATSLTTPLNFSGVDNNIIQAGPQAADQNATNTIFNGSLALLQPGFAQSKQQLEDQLSQQGIPVGSPAYNAAMTNLAANQGMTTTAALGTAEQAGVQAGSNVYSGAIAGQGQQIGQQQTAQTNPLTNLTKLYSSGTGA